jgi:hypothetical protein
MEAGIISNMFEGPKDDDKYEWTNHVKDKMGYYRLSESLIKRIVRFPHRTEEGIAPGTTAVMQSRTRPKKVNGKTAKSVEEIWVMYVETGGKKKNKSALEKLLIRPKKRIISAWRYPGQSPLGKKIPIPDEILQELEGLLQ